MKTLLAATLAALCALPPADDDSGPAKLRLILELEPHVTDSAVVDAYVSIIAKATEWDLARIECLKILELWPPTDEQRRTRVGRVIAAALESDEDNLVRQYAAMTLAAYLDDDVVFTTLTRATLTDDDPTVRLNAFASIEKRGKSERTIDLLHRLLDDPDVGGYSKQVLDMWRDE